ncbi:hypothetical protein PVAP13_8KG279300 [Panicum virgatum]|uniref:Uncharacterized protein n=1 Tax=Panicum virgatum TaxID=38727 RepID=A0A8T0PR96_PANVG|nr:hypothetical protein PVAP13_8KG279300 [Panicum virgatum]
MIQKKTARLIARRHSLALPHDPIAPAPLSRRSWARPRRRSSTTPSTSTASSPHDDSCPHHFTSLCWIHRRRRPDLAWRRSNPAGIGRIRWVQLPSIHPGQRQGPDMVRHRRRDLAKPLCARCMQIAAKKIY